MRATRSFWRSVILTGNQTTADAVAVHNWFWRSVILTGNQTNPNVFWSYTVLGAFTIGNVAIHIHDKKAKGGEPADDSE